MTFASMANEFAANNCALLGLSVDSNPSHIDWSRAMERYQWRDIKNPKITFPIVADDFGMVARLYGMLMPSASATRTVRTVFFIDPEGIIRAMLLYPLTTGRNMKEIMRLLLAMQAYDKTGYATPADWMPGEPQVLPAPQTLPAAMQRLNDEKEKAFYCLDWYICFTRDSEPANMSKQMTNESTEAANMAPTPNTNNINNMADIMDMMGAAGMLTQASMPKAPANVKGKQMPSSTAPVLSAATNVKGMQMPSSTVPVMPPPTNVKGMQMPSSTVPVMPPPTNVKSMQMPSSTTPVMSAPMNIKGMQMPFANSKILSSPANLVTPYKQPEIIQPATHQTMKPNSHSSGIMEQNRLLFDIDDGFGTHKDYMITRDYPNGGL